MADPPWGPATTAGDAATLSTVATATAGSFLLAAECLLAELGFLALAGEDPRLEERRGVDSPLAQSLGAATTGTAGAAGAAATADTAAAATSTSLLAPVPACFLSGDAFREAELTCLSGVAGELGPFWPFAAGDAFRLGLPGDGAPLLCLLFAGESGAAG